MEAPGSLPERPKGADCKSAALRFGGSNPSTATNGPTVFRGAFCVPRRLAAPAAHCLILDDCLTSCASYALEGGWVGKELHGSCRGRARFRADCGGVVGGGSAWRGFSWPPRLRSRRSVIVGADSSDERARFCPSGRVITITHPRILYTGLPVCSLFCVAPVAQW